MMGVARSLNQNVMREMAIQSIRKSKTYVCTAPLHALTGRRAVPDMDSLHSLPFNQLAGLAIKQIDFHERDMRLCDIKVKMTNG